MTPIENKYKPIGKRVRSARKSAGLSQKQLAEKIGLKTATAVYLIESGERKIGAVDLEKIAKTLNRDIKYFLGAENEAPSIRVALRSDPNLKEEDKSAILRFIELAKKRRDK